MKEMGLVTRVEIGGVRFAKGEVRRKDWVRVTQQRAESVP